MGKAKIAVTIDEKIVRRIRPACSKKSIPEQKSGNRRSPGGKACQAGQVEACKRGRETLSGIRTGTRRGRHNPGLFAVASILRGDIRWAGLNTVRGHEQAGTRPDLILSNDVFNEGSGTVIAMAITSQSQRAGFPLRLALK